MHFRFGLILGLLALPACAPVPEVENAQAVAHATPLQSASYTFPNGRTVVFQVFPGMQERTRRPATGLFVDYGDAGSNLRLAASSEVSALECGRSELNCENLTIQQASGDMAFALRRLTSPQSEYDILVSDDRSPRYYYHAVGRTRMPRASSNLQIEIHCAAREICLSAIKGLQSLSFK